MPKDKPDGRPSKRIRDDDRFIEAMKAINDRADVFLLITAEREGGGLPTLGIYASDDYSHERLWNAAMLEMAARFPFAGEVIGEPDADESDDETE